MNYGTTIKHTCLCWGKFLAGDEVLERRLARLLVAPDVAGKHVRGQGHELEAHEEGDGFSTCGRRPPEGQPPSHAAPDYDGVLCTRACQATVRYQVLARAARGSS